MDQNFGQYETDDDDDDEITDERTYGRNMII